MSKLNWDDSPWGWLGESQSSLSHPRMHPPVVQDGLVPPHGSGRLPQEDDVDAAEASLPVFGQPRKRQVFIVHTPACRGDALKAEEEALLFGLNVECVSLATEAFKAMRREWDAGLLKNSIMILLIGKATRLGKDVSADSDPADLAIAMAEQNTPVKVFMRNTVDPSCSQVRRDLRRRLHQAASSSRSKRADASMPALAVADYRGEHKLRSGVQLFLRSLKLTRDLGVYNRYQALSFSYSFEQPDENGVVAEVAHEAFLAGLNIDSLECHADRDPISVRFSGTFKEGVSPDAAQAFARRCRELFPSHGPLVYCGPSSSSKQRFEESEREALVDLSVRGVPTEPGRLATTLTVIQECDANFTRVLIKERYRDASGNAGICQDINISIDVAHLRKDEDQLRDLFDKLRNISGYKGHIRIAPSQGSGHETERRILAELDLLPLRLQDPKRRVS